jgi:hypothetical protein
MSHFRLSTVIAKQRFNVVVMKAPSMIHARLKAALVASDGSMIFTEGHELSAEMALLVQPGGVLSADEAMELLSRLAPSGRVAKKPG